MTDSKPKAQNEGEGSRTAAREYNEATRKFVESGKVDSSAADAKRAIESGERKDLEAAEKEGLRHANEEDPALRRSR